MSEAFLAYFFYNRVNDPLSNTLKDGNMYSTATSTFLDNSGNGQMAAVFLSSWCGVVPETLYSLEDAKNGIKPDDSVAYSNNVSLLKNIVTVQNPIS